MFVCRVLLLTFSNRVDTEHKRNHHTSLTLKHVIAAEFGNIRMMGNEVLQEMRELVSLAQQHVAAHQVLVHHAQVVVVAEGVHVHEVPHLVTLLGEEHGELEGGRQPNDHHHDNNNNTNTHIQLELVRSNVPVYRVLFVLFC